MDRNHPTEQRGGAAQRGPTAGSGLALGLAIGLACGVALGNIGVGIALGLAFGVAFDAKRANARDDNGA